MASLPRSSIRDIPDLQQFLLSDVVGTGKTLGVGSYGSVLEVKYQGSICAAKKIHQNLLNPRNEGVAIIGQKYKMECTLMANLRHPNIVQFLGLFLESESEMPLLVMEKLEMSLDDLLETVSNISLSTKVSILENITNGLVYLHHRDPPIIHRDLTAKNILLTTSLQAKISDLGNSRIPNMKSGDLAMMMSGVPGTLVYMPPEALRADSTYGTSLDVFSFGHLTLYTIIQEFPGNLHSAFNRSEVERRGNYFARLQGQAGNIPHNIIQLMRDCLNNNPNLRPSSKRLLAEVTSVKAEVEKKQGVSVGKTDICQVLLTREMTEKEKTIKELESQKERDISEKNEIISRLQREKDEQQRQMQRQARKSLHSLASAEINVQYRDTPPQVFISNLNRFIRENQPPRGFSAHISWERVLTEEEREQEDTTSLVRDTPRGYKTISDVPVLRGHNHCEHCLCAPCIVVRPPDFLRGSCDPHPANSEKRHMLYKKFWRCLSTIGVWNDEMYLRRKEGQMARDDKREIIPSCIIEEIRRRYPSHDGSYRDYLSSFDASFDIGVDMREEITEDMITT